MHLLHTLHSSLSLAPTMRYSIITFLLLFSISSFTDTLATCGSCPPTTIPKLPIPNVPTLPPVPVIGKPPVELPPVPVIGKPPVDLPKLPPVPIITPPVVTPPAVKTPPATPKPGCAPPKKPHKKAKCPIDTIKLGACLDVLGAVWHVGDPAVKCCPLIEGLTSVEAALCLCTVIKAKALGLSVYVPVAVEFLLSCGKKIPPGYKCP